MQSYKSVTLKGETTGTGYVGAFEWHETLRRSVKNALTSASQMLLSRSQNILFLYERKVVQRQKNGENEGRRGSERDRKQREINQARYQQNNNLPLFINLTSLLSFTLRCEMCRLPGNYNLMSLDDVMSNSGGNKSDP